MKYLADKLLLFHYADRGSSTADKVLIQYALAVVFQLTATVMVPSGELTKTSFALTAAKIHLLTTNKLTAELYILKGFLIIDCEIVCKYKGANHMFQALQTNIKEVTKSSC